MAEDHPYAPKKLKTKSRYHRPALGFGFSWEMLQQSQCKKCKGTVTVSAPSGEPRSAACTSCSQHYYPISARDIYNAARSAKLGTLWVSIFVTGLIAYTWFTMDTERIRLNYLTDWSLQQRDRTLSDHNSLSLSILDLSQRLDELQAQAQDDLERTRGWLDTVYSRQTSITEGVRQASLYGQQLELRFHEGMTEMSTLRLQVAVLQQQVEALIEAMARESHKTSSRRKGGHLVPCVPSGGSLGE